MTPEATHSLPVRVGARSWTPFSVVGLVLVLLLWKVPLRTTTGGDTATEPVDVPFRGSGQGHVSTARLSGLSEALILR